jgi:hypothetical protein
MPALPVSIRKEYYALHDVQRSSAHLAGRMKVSWWYNWGTYGERINVKRTNNELSRPACNVKASWALVSFPLRWIERASANDRVVVYAQFRTGQARYIDRLADLTPELLRLPDDGLSNHSAFEMHVKLDKCTHGSM